MARLVSVNVGLPRDIEWKGRTVHTGIWKEPVRGRCRVNKLNLQGDGQGDLAGHGGEQRAVFVYQLESYLYWQRQLRRADFVHGQFGENFTIEGLPDDVVCIGDTYRIGSALFEVTQPRVTCYRVGIRMNEPRMPSRPATSSSICDGLAAPVQDLVGIQPAAKPWSRTPVESTARLGSRRLGGNRRPARILPARCKTRAHGRRRSLGYRLPITLF